MGGLPFRRSIEITQNATRAPKRKPQAFESGSNEVIWLILHSRYAFEAKLEINAQSAD